MEVEKMKNTRMNLLPVGGIKFSTILMLVVVFYAGFVLVKVVSANIMRGQIRADIIDQMGYYRGPDFTIEAGEKVITEILKKHGVLDLEYDNEYYDDDYVYSEAEKKSDNPEDYKGHGINISLNDKKSMINFHLRYKYTNDFIFFKTVKVYDVEGELQNFN